VQFKLSCYRIERFL